SRPIFRSTGKRPPGPMEVKRAGVVAAIEKKIGMGIAMRSPWGFRALAWPLLAMFFSLSPLRSQMTDNSYQKSALETSEVDLLFSYYDQDGKHAAVTGGEGTQALTDVSSSIVLRMPINENDVLTVDVGISAYTSASSSNVNPLDGSALTVTPFDASSGESRKDMLTYINPSYSHMTPDRNGAWSANAYFSTEYDYYSIGFGGSYSRLFNERNTELTMGVQVFLDKWNARYPIELREGFFDDRVSGSGTYAPIFVPFERETRNSYSLSLSVSQVLGKKLQGSLFVDLVSQHGLLSTPFHRVHVSDFEDFHIDLFQLADDVERLPDSRLKIPIGGRLNYYLGDLVVLRSYYRYYWDDWGISSHTAS